MSKEEQTSFRIKFEKSDVEFMNDYKDVHGATIQWFVEKAVKDRIQDIKVKQQLEEL